jgi:hypothetical protein
MDCTLFISWTGTHYRISSSLPVGCVIDGMRTTMVAATGSFMPDGFPSNIYVDRATDWMARLTSQGFSFALMR